VRIKQFIFNVMPFIFFQITALLAVICFTAVMFILRAKARKKSKSVTKYKIDTDTTYARYAINENGFLEEINEGKLSKYRN
jgi:hypothetical protein